jgi:phosphoglycerol transferase MdoB-like AlkP superfamily enzyme
VLTFVPTLGFDTFEGEGSMDPKYPRNEWGVYDEYLFDYLYGKLAAAAGGKPKFIFAMSTSNHPPYSLPAGYRLLPLAPSPELDRQITGDRTLAGERFKTYQYACQKVGEFISRVKASPLADDTIIAVTGDHNFWSVFDYPAERYLDLDGVPFYLYVPARLRPAAADTSVFGSHIDIMPTLYNLSLSGAGYVGVGVDLLDPGAQHIAYNVDGIVLSKDGGLRYFPETSAMAAYTWAPGAARHLAAAAAGTVHERLLRHYKAALAVTEYLIRNPFPVDGDQKK